MKRGQVWTVAAGSGFGAKPRPCVLVQSDAYSENQSVVICIVTTDVTVADFRIVIEASPENGLERRSRIAADKVLTVRRSKLGQQIGELRAEDLARLDAALVLFLGLGSN